MKGASLLHRWEVPLLLLIPLSTSAQHLRSPVKISVLGILLIRSRDMALSRLYSLDLRLKIRTLQGHPTLVNNRASPLRIQGSNSRLLLALLPTLPRQIFSRRRHNRSPRLLTKAGYLLEKTLRPTKRRGDMRLTSSSSNRSSNKLIRTLIILPLASSSNYQPRRTPVTSVHKEPLVDILISLVVITTSLQREDLPPLRMLQTTALPFMHMVRGMELAVTSKRLLFCEAANIRTHVCQRHRVWRRLDSVVML